MHNIAQVIAGVWEVFQGVKRHEEILNCETLLTSFETFFALFRSRRYDNYNHLLVAVWHFFFELYLLKTFHIIPNWSSTAKHLLKICRRLLSGLLKPHHLVWLINLCWNIFVQHLDVILSSWCHIFLNISIHNGL